MKTPASTLKEIVTEFCYANVCSPYDVPFEYWDEMDKTDMIDELCNATPKDGMVVVRDKYIKKGHSHCIPVEPKESEQ